MKCIYLLFFFIFSLTGLNAENNNMLDDWKYLIGAQNQSYDDIENKEFLNYNYNINSRSISALIPGKEGFIWLKKEFMLPQSLYGKNVSIILGKIIIASETYFNGKLLGTSGKFPPDIFCEWNDYIVFDLPDNSLFKDKKNTVLMKIYVNGEGSISGIVKLGEKNKIRSLHYILQFFDLNIHVVSSALILIFCIYHLMLFLKRPKERYNLYYALLCFSVLLYQLDYYYSRIANTFEINLDYFLLLKLFNNQVFLIFFFLCLFLTNFLNHKKTKAEKIFLIVFLVLPIILTSSIPVYKTFITVRNYSNIFIFVNIAYTLYVVIHSLKDKNPDGFSVFFITTIWFICVAFDVIFHGFFNYQTLPYVSVIGFAFFIIGIALIMANKFINLYKELEFLNTNLEKKVEERTNEIKAAYDELSDSNKELKRAQSKLIKYATTDHLTGLYNRFELQKRINEEISRNKRYKNKTNKNFSVVFIDLDNFKYYNDTFGHEIGDLILVEFSNILKRITRTVDIIARYGGDEFVIVLPVTDCSGAECFVKRIYEELKKCNFFIDLIEKRISKKIVIKDKNMISCSMGIVSSSETIDNKNILQKADEALYMAKKKGKNSFCFWGNK